MATTTKKLKTNINFIVPLVVYPFDVMVSIAQDDDQLGSVFDKMDRLKEDDIRACAYPSPFTQGKAVMFSTNQSIIRLRKLPEASEEYGTMAHEIFHIVTFILDRVGVKLVIEISDEPYAYLVGYLTTEIYKRINKYY